MAKASEVLKVAASQIGVKESPANSNKTKYGKSFGENGVPWCAIFLWWDFQKAKAGSLFPHNSNAAYAQDQIVSKCGGKWAMKKTTIKATRKAYLRMAKPGDVVCMDFGRMDAYRSHIGIVEKVDGTNLICIEGNTSKSGSQSNGGMVCRQVRPYTYICSAARPAYSDAAPVEKPKPDPVTKPLDTDGILGYQTACRMQNWLGTTVDGEIGPNTVRALQKKIGAKPVDGKWGKHTSEVFQRYLNKNGANPKLADDGVFGKKSVKALQTFLNRYYSDKGTKPQPKPTPAPKPAAKTSAEKICDQAKACAWPEGTAKSKYSYPGGSATAAFKTAIAKAYPNRSKWGTQTRAGASCDVFVGTVIRSTGYDTKFPRGLDGVEKHCKDNPLWKDTGIRDLDKLKPGDVVFYLYKGGGHIYIYVGDKKIANAHYNGKTFGIIQKLSSARKPADTMKFIVYRAAK